MRISKMIVALLVSVVAVTAMTGVAVAAPAEIDILPDGFVLIPGQYVNTTAHLYEMVNDGTARTLDVSVQAGTANDLTFKVIDNNPGGGTVVATVGGISYTYTPPIASVTYDIYVEVMAAPGTEGNTYTLFYEDTQSGNFDTASATVHTDAIPEFATITIPAIAVLGLFLFFNKRKHKKD